MGARQRVWEHSDATISDLAVDAAGHVPWWREEVKLFNIMVHVLADATRPAGHAGILREQLTRAAGVSSPDGVLAGTEQLYGAHRFMRPDGAQLISWLAPIVGPGTAVSGDSPATIQDGKARS